MTKKYSCKDCFHDYHCPARQEGLDYGELCEEFDLWVVKK